MAQTPSCEPPPSFDRVRARSAVRLCQGAGGAAGRSRRGLWADRAEAESRALQSHEKPVELRRFSVCRHVWPVSSLSCTDPFAFALGR